MYILRLAAASRSFIAPSLCGGDPLSRHRSLAIAPRPVMTTRSVDIASRVSAAAQLLICDAACILAAAQRFANDGTVSAISSSLHALKR